MAENINGFHWRELSPPFWAELWAPAYHWWFGLTLYILGNFLAGFSLQGTNVSHLGNSRKIIFKSALAWDMLVYWRVTPPSIILLIGISGQFVIESFKFLVRFDWVHLVRLYQNRQNTLQEVLDGIKLEEWWDNSGSYMVCFDPMFKRRCSMLKLPWIRLSDKEAQWYSGHTKQRNYRVEPKPVV